MQMQEVQQQAPITQSAWRVWPDGTVQSTDEAIHFWMGDDYQLVSARSADEALEIANMVMPEQD